MHDIRDARCLDAFAGSGALGFEAYSRGAAHVTLLEKEPSAYANLSKQALSFNSSQLVVKKMDACDFLQQAQTKEQFTIVFLDPPFAKNYWPLCLQALASSNILLPGGLLYLESPVEMTVDRTSWQQLKLKTAGQIVYGLYKKTTSA